MARPARSFLHYRDALSDWNHVASAEMFAGSDAATRPVLSIMIPTYKRYDLLAETVASAMAQDIEQAFEIVVVDNDPESEGAGRLVDAIPDLARANFRYLRNSENLGADGNVNRCVTSARGEWITLLHDDDLLDPDFARRTLDDLLARPSIDGLVCRKRGFDQRATIYTMSRASILLRNAYDAYQFGFRKLRRIDARKLFWGCVVGNTVGFICRTEAIRDIGGFYPEEYPSADYFFYARFAQRFLLAETRDIRATIRIAVNSLTRKDIQLACLRRGFELQSAYAGAVLPNFWSRFSPLVVARQIARTSIYWQSVISRQEAEESIGVKLSRDRPLTLYAVRALMRGF